MQKSAGRHAKRQAKLNERIAKRARIPSQNPGPMGSPCFICTPLEWLDRVAVLIPPPRRHRHRYHGVLAPNAHSVRL